MLPSKIKRPHYFREKEKENKCEKVLRFGSERSCTENYRTGIWKNVSEILMQLMTCDLVSMAGVVPDYPTRAGEVSCETQNPLWVLYILIKLFIYLGNSSIWWALRVPGDPKWLFRLVKALHDTTRSKVFQQLT